MHIAKYIEQLHRVRSLTGRICLVLTPQDFFRGDVAIDQVRVTQLDVMNADRVIVVNSPSSPDAPIDIIVLKDRGDDLRDYMYIARPTYLAFD